jgi:hypothetical protein
VATLEVPEPRVLGVLPVPSIDADRQGVDVEGEFLVVIRLRRVVSLNNRERLPVIRATSVEGLESGRGVKGKWGAQRVISRAHVL